MKKIMAERIKLISLIYVCVLIMQGFVGCDESYKPSNNWKISTRLEKIDYIADNFDEYKNRIKEETELEGKIVSEEVNKKEQKYIEFDVDSTTIIKFESNDVGVTIIKQIERYNGTNSKREIEILLIGMNEDDKVRISLKGNGSISCDYKANDLEHPLPSQKEKDECIDIQIKRAASTEELKELTSKAHSIYNVFEEICNEYNESLKNESR